MNDVLFNGNMVKFRKLEVVPGVIDVNERQITKIDIKGYKSIKHASVDLDMINVLIGSNGSGKSNFISLFKMIQNIIDENLQYYVGKNGGPDKLLYFGSKVTNQLSVNIYFGNNGYSFSLSPTSNGKLIFEDESFYWNINGSIHLGRGHFESLYKKGCGNGIDNYILPVLNNKKWRVYHFHDTSENAPVKTPASLNDNEFLAADARNIAPFLYCLKETNKQSYAMIVEIIKMALPFFDDFVLRPNPLMGNEYMTLEWKDVSSDIPLDVSQLSDGGLRFICLTTLLMQPKELLPDTIIIDEPELGLHPSAIDLFASMVKKIANDIQVIISTQSVELLSHFSPDDVIVVNHENNQSVFKRLDYNELKQWLNDDYLLGDLWKMNIFGGRP